MFGLGTRELIILMLIYLVLPFSAAIQAHKKKRSEIIWFFGTLLFPPVWIVIRFIIKNEKKQEIIKHIDII